MDVFQALEAVPSARLQAAVLLIRAPVGLVLGCGPPMGHKFGVG